MSSNIRIQRVCEYCEKAFIAKTTTTRYSTCNSRHYKVRVKELKQVVSNKETKEKVIKHTKFKDLNLKKVLSINEAAAYMGVSRSTIYRLITENKLTIIKVRGRVLISRVLIEKRFEL